MKIFTRENSPICSTCVSESLSFPLNGTCVLHFLCRLHVQICDVYHNGRSDIVVTERLGDGPPQEVGLRELRVPNSSGLRNSGQGTVHPSKSQCYLSEGADQGYRISCRSKERRNPLDTPLLEAGRSPGLHGIGRCSHPPDKRYQGYFKFQCVYQSRLLY